MMDTFIDIVAIGFFWKVIFLGVIWKVIIAHALADYILKWANRWLDGKPTRREHYEALLHYHRTKPEQI